MKRSVIAASTEKPALPTMLAQALNGCLEVTRCAADPKWSPSLGLQSPLAGG